MTKLVDFGGFRILSSKNTQGVRVIKKISLRMFLKISDRMVSCHGLVYILSPAQFHLWGSLVNMMSLVTSSIEKHVYIH